MGWCSDRCGERMILVTVGTHEQPFDRLLRGAEHLAQQLDERVVVQGGPSIVPTPTCERTAWMAPEQLAATIEAARLVVLHGGPSTLSEVLDAGVLAVVVPRDPDRCEHVDAHQQRFAASLPPDIPVFIEVDRLVEWVVAGELPPPPHRPRSAAATAAFAEGLESILSGIRRPAIGRHGGIRAMVRRISRRLPPGS